MSSSGSARFLESSGVVLDGLAGHHGALGPDAIVNGPRRGLELLCRGRRPAGRPHRLSRPAPHPRPQRSCGPSAPGASHEIVMLTGDPQDVARAIADPSGSIVWSPASSPTEGRVRTGPPGERATPSRSSATASTTRSAWRRPTSGSPSTGRRTSPGDGARRPAGREPLESPGGAGPRPRGHRPDPAGLGHQLLPQLRGHRPDVARPDRPDRHHADQQRRGFLATLNGLRPLMEDGARRRPHPESARPATSHRSRHRGGHPAEEQPQHEMGGRLNKPLEPAGPGRETRQHPDDLMAQKLGDLPGQHDRGVRGRRARPGPRSPCPCSRPRSRRRGSPGRRSPRGRAGSGRCP